MPEMPEVQALAVWLKEHVCGMDVARVELAALQALKTFDPPLDALVGKTVSDVGRWGKHLGLQADGLWLVVHFSRGGWLHWRESTPMSSGRLGSGPLSLRVGFSEGSGFDITEHGKERRLAVWVVEDPLALPQISSLGPDPLSDSFDLASFKAALGDSKGQLKTVLSDQHVISGIGNAYSDEILHKAHLSPFKQVSKLTEEEMTALYEATVAELAAGLKACSGLPPGKIKAAKHARYAVHARTGQPCPACGDTVREVSMTTRSFQYCPTCQTGGKVHADRRMSRLLR